MAVVSSLPASIWAVYRAAFSDVSEKSTGMITRCIVVGLFLNDKFNGFVKQLLILFRRTLFSRKECTC